MPPGATGIIRLVLNLANLDLPAVHMQYGRVCWKSRQCKNGAMRKTDNSLVACKVGEGCYDYGEFKYCFNYPVFDISEPLLPRPSGALQPAEVDFTNKCIPLVDAEWYPADQLSSGKESVWKTPLLHGTPKSADEPLVWAATLHPENMYRVPVQLPGTRPGVTRSAMALVELEHRHS